MGLPTAGSPLPWDGKCRRRFVFHASWPLGDALLGVISCAVEVRWVSAPVWLKSQGSFVVGVCCGGPDRYSVGRAYLAWWPFCHAEHPVLSSCPPEHSQRSIPYLGVPSSLYSVPWSAEFTLLRTLECRVHSTPYLGVKSSLKVRDRQNRQNRQNEKTW